jgi:hypothetical protein
VDRGDQKKSNSTSAYRISKARAIPEDDLANIITNRFYVFFNGGEKTIRPEWRQGCSKFEQPCWFTTIDA